ncbi:MAG: hypothetical protein ABSH30_03240 [Acidimicrobiales bacterium]|jgi:hypothetical protein
MSNPRRIFAIIIGIIALLALAAGIVYLTVASSSLPAWFPGHARHHVSRATHSHRGIAGVAVGVVLLVVSIGLYISSRTTNRAPRWR